MPAPKAEFPLVDEYVSTRLGPLLPTLPEGRHTVVESSRRLTAEQSYGYVHALWWVWLADGRSVVSVPPGFAHEIRRLLGSPGSDEAIFEDDLADRLRPPVDRALREAGLLSTDRILLDLVLACDASLLRRHPHAACQALKDSAIPPADGLHLPTHCFPDGHVFGVVADGEIASFAFAHRSDVLENQVADIGVETAASHRRKGFARAVVSALVADFVERGGEARYGCSPDNVASRATAASVGFVPYAKSMILAAPRPQSPASGHRGPGRPEF